MSIAIAWGCLFRQVVNMKITKIGHCCLIIEDKGKKILTDPGVWNTGQNEVTGIDLIDISHEHADHFYLESLKRVLKNNPQATIVTNAAVSKLLEAENIASNILKDQQKENFEGFEITACGTVHAVIHSRLPVVMNTGYLFENKFFYPGDALTNPGAAVQILAMPMVGPWMKLSEAIDWATMIKPEVCIPVHDGMLNPRQWIYTNPTRLLAEEGIIFEAVEPGESREY